MPTAQVIHDLRLIDYNVPMAGYRDTIHRGEVNVDVQPEWAKIGFNKIPITIFKLWKERGLITMQEESEDEMSNLPAVQQEETLSIERLKGQVNLIQHVMREVMHKDEHYGVIPGCLKPSLLKPGAEKLSLTFRLAPSYDWTEKEMPNGHREYVMRCVLKHIESNKVFGEGVGSCTTMEAKYRFRKAEQKCPECGKDTIIKGKKEYGGGWLCFQKKGGCGAKFKDGDERIENQEMGRVEHDNPADYYNTVIKMAKKRAHVDAVLTATAASDIFTQDVEDMVENGTIKPEEKTKQEATTKKDQTPPQKEKSTFKGCTKEQAARLQELYKASFNEYDQKHFTAVITHFRKGVKLSFDEAEDLLYHWQARLDDYEAAKMKEEDVNV